MSGENESHVFLTLMLAVFVGFLTYNFADIIEIFDAYSTPELILPEPSVTALEIGPQSDRSDEQRVEEDRALERFRQEIIKEDQRHDRLKVISRVNSPTDEEDEDTKAIFEIVRLAQTQHSRGRSVQIANRNAAYVDEDGVILPSISGAMCLIKEDCTTACEDACKTVAGQQLCAGQCKNKCTRTCQRRSSQDGEQNCEETCERSCVNSCLRATDSTLIQQGLCREETKAKCSAECKGTRKTAQIACEDRCLEKATDSCTGRLNENCREQCGRHLCVDSKCTCPVYFSGDPMCSKPLDITSQLPRRYADCAAPVTHSKFNTNKNINISLANLNHPITADYIAQAHRREGGIKRRWKPDLPMMADFSTCAIVGSSTSMKGKGAGAEIDGHTAVFRFNDAPTEGFEEDVGRKTTLRVQNVMTCGWHESTGEMCLHYTGWTGNTCERENLDWWKDCKTLRLSDRMLLYVKVLFRDPRSIFLRDRVMAKSTILGGGRHKEANRDTSAGFFGIALALHMCGKVNIYGFSQGSGHYFKKIDRSRGQRRFAAKHAWALERQCVNVVSSLQGVAKHS
ncbi:hypothetical protein CYMTET_48173 [Cymbomonas tetramitiformis]|uniref:beta-galactoside alpha-(2,6)-sialyltransferase n=1 Tax=Cymbomonas tetramitiformis TaxID=36881 RepID=A0AAE0BST3_9CHLO|nr:hypothetical protein CYMTET_48173 [Cymbomonas tetramitiformis]